MRTRLQGLLVGGALLAGWATPSWAQDAPSDARWLAFLGCWQSTAAVREWLCVTAASESSVELATVVDGRVTDRERIAATGERVPSTRDGCTGWASAKWSAEGQRVYLRSELECAGGVQRASSGVVAMVSGNEWLRVHGLTVAGRTAVRVDRYRVAHADAPLLGEIPPAPPADVRPVRDARLAAAAPIGVGDVVEASGQVDGTVVEAWLAERAQSFALDAKQLVTLADAKVPDRVIDLMVALSYPRAFERRFAGGGVGGEVPWPMVVGGAPFRAMDALCYGPFAASYLWSYDCSPFGYGVPGYNGGWYTGGYPMVIVLQGGGARPHGRVVNGRGYAPGGDATPQQSALPRNPPPADARVGSGSGTGSTSSSSGGGGEQRTAKPRPPK
jgi:hypothetical protein